MENYIKGNYCRSIYESDKGYIIGIFKVKETNDSNMEDYIEKTVTFTGYFSELNKDDLYILYGEALEHPKYGFQYQVKNYDRIKPEDSDGIIAFLASDLFPTIGETLARRIVNTLGLNTLDLILEDKNNLLLASKISNKKVNLIYDTLISYESSHKTIVYLTELGFNMKDSLNIYNKYKDKTVSYLENNIYSILDEVKEISFLKIDEIAKKMGMNNDDDRRIKASIIYIMKYMININGDTYLTVEDIYDRLMNYLKIDISINVFDSFLNELNLEGKIIIDNEHYYLTEIYESELNIVNRLSYLNSTDKTKLKKIDEIIKSMEKGNGIIYDDLQKEAITKALEDNILIITGGPGTGKTTIIKAIVEAYQILNDFNYDELVKKIALLAPTGRASKRMSEATFLPATTIHRFLKWNKETDEFAINEYNKDESNLIIVDEASMIDINLFDSLLKGLTNNIKLILVGDYNQLPSVGPGQILKDIIESNTIRTIQLNLLYRQSEESYIPILANNINNNSLDDDYLEPKNDFTFLECSNKSIKKNLKNICIQIINKNYDYKRVQIMAPMYAGINGIDNLNKDLQQVFNPESDSKKEIKIGDIIYRENDKILQLVNMPDDNVFNGDVGILCKIVDANNSDSKKNEIYVDYDGNIVKYLPKDFVKIKHGFIISIHKSQGSEFEMVIMPMDISYKRMLYKKLIYTAVTRAKKKLIILGDVNAFLYAINNENEYIRKTNLKQKLIDSIKSNI